MSAQERSSSPAAPSDGPSDTIDFEDLLARSIDARVGRDEGLIDALCRQFPEHASRLHARLAELERIGMLEPSRVQAALPLPPAIGAHAILRRLGSGGMGEVFLAREPSGRLVALKWARLGSSDGQEDARALLRFEREARAIASLSHPNVAGLVATGQHDGRPWFTLEFVAGVTLAAVLHKLRLGKRPGAATAWNDIESAWNAAAREQGDGSLDLAVARFLRASSPLEWAARVAQDVAQALVHVHAQGIVHRDVKPSNIMIRRDGSACLLDLGLAHFADLPALTRSGDFAGTPYYVAPEQVEQRGRGVDARTDVWALGVTLFEMVTLTRPFEGQGTPEIMKRVLVSEPPRPRALCPGMPVDLEAVLLKCLEKRPRRRYAGSAELAADLERFVTFQPVLARPASGPERALEWARRRPTLALAAGLSAVVVLGLPIGLWMHGRAIQREARRTSLAAQLAQEQAQAHARTLEHVVELFRPGGGGSPLAPTSIVAALDSQVERLQASTDESNLTRTTWLEAVGTIYRNLGLSERALPLLDRALALRANDAGGPDAGVALLEVLATVHLQLADAATARALCERALREVAAGTPTDGIAGARCRATLARALCLQSEWEAAEREFDLAIERFAAQVGLGPDAHLDFARAVEDRARLYERRGHAARAALEFERALDARSRAWLPDPVTLAACQRELHRLYAGLGAAKEAARAARCAEALEQATQLPPPPGKLPRLALFPSWKASYDEHFQRGISALQTRDLETARASFEKCLELKPHEGVCAYNLACTHALGAAPEAAFQWLERAASWGWGFSERQIELLERDPDLERLRRDPRWSAYLAARRRDILPMREFVATPAVHAGAPARVESSRPRGALIVLHDAGATKLDVAASSWRALAESLDCVLVAPSATLPQGSDPRLGLAWFSDLAAFVEQPWIVERPLLEQIDAALKEHALDPARVVLAGEGQGGIVAFDLALRAPGRFRGVCVEDAACPGDDSVRRARVAAALGCRLAFVATPNKRLFGWAQDESEAQALRAMTDWVRAIFGPLGTFIDGDERRAERLGAWGAAALAERP